MQRFWYGQSPAAPPLVRTSEEHRLGRFDGGGGRGPVVVVVLVDVGGEYLVAADAVHLDLPPVGLRLDHHRRLRLARRLVAVLATAVPTSVSFASLPALQLALQRRLGPLADRVAGRTCVFRIFPVDTQTGEHVTGAGSHSHPSAISLSTSAATTGRYPASTVASLPLTRSLLKPIDPFENTVQHLGNGTLT